MQFSKMSKALAGVAVLALVGAVASADVWNKKTNLTVKETIEVPGAVLEPGEYVVKLVDSQSNRHIVQFLNKEEDEVLSTVIAIPNSRPKPTGETEFEWYETPAGQPPALRAWFYPGDSFGQEFAYPEGRAAELSAATKQEVPELSDEDAAIAANREQQREETEVAQADLAEQQAAQRERDMAAQRERERETAAQREREIAAQRERDQQAQQDRERQLAQAEQTQQEADRTLTAQAPQPEPIENELPETAGLGALLALIGLGSLGASRAVRKLRNK